MIKHLLKIVWFVGVAMSSLAPLPPAAAATETVGRYIVVVSPYLDADREIVFREIVGLALEGVAPGSSIVVLNAVDLNEVAHLRIPPDEVYRRNASARARTLAPSLAPLRQFFATDFPHPPEMRGAIHVPQALALASSHLRRPGEAITVILTGTAFYVDADGAFNMLGGYVPSDEHLRGSSRRSVYGTADKSGALQGVTVHYAYLRENFEHAEHRDAVARMWSLLIQGQQGTLASFAASPALVYRRVTEGAREPILQASLNDQDREFVMRRLRHVRLDNPPQPSINPVPTALTERAGARTTVSPSELAVPLSALSPASAALPATAALLTNVIPATLQVGKQGIAIAWHVQGDSRDVVDVDLWVKPPNSPELFYANKAGPNARYLRDIQRAAGTAGYAGHPEENWEYVELDAGIALSATSVWLDLYKNDGRAAVEGVVIIVASGRITERPFKFPAGLAGDQRQQTERRGQDPHWIQVDLAALLNRS